MFEISLAAKLASGLTGSRADAHRIGASHQHAIRRKSTLNRRVPHACNRARTHPRVTDSTPSRLPSRVFNAGPIVSGHGGSGRGGGGCRCWPPETPAHHGVSIAVGTLGAPRFPRQRPACRRHARARDKVAEVAYGSRVNTARGVRAADEGSRSRPSLSPSWGSMHARRSCRWLCCGRRTRLSWLPGPCAKRPGQWTGCAGSWRRSRRVRLPAATEPGGAAMRCSGSLIGVEPAARRSRRLWCPASRVSGSRPTVEMHGPWPGKRCATCAEPAMTRAWTASDRHDPLGQARQGRPLPRVRLCRRRHPSTSPATSSRPAPRPPVATRGGRDATCPRPC